MNIFLKVALALTAVAALLLLAACSSPTNSPEPAVSDTQEEPTVATEETAQEVADVDSSSELTDSDNNLADADTESDEETVATTEEPPTPEATPTSWLLEQLPSQGVAPEITNEVWINSEPLTLEDLRGQVVLIEFWTYG